MKIPYLHPRLLLCMIGSQPFTCKCNFRNSGGIHCVHEISLFSQFSQESLMKKISLILYSFYVCNFLKLILIIVFSILNSFMICVLQNVTVWEFIFHFSRSRSRKTHPGPVVHLSDNPMDSTKVSSDLRLCFMRFLPAGH